MWDFFVLIPVLFERVGGAAVMGHAAMGMVQLRGGGFICGGGLVSVEATEAALREEPARRCAELEKTYGDQSPWVQVNKHFAALEKLKEGDGGGEERGGIGLSCRLIGRMGKDVGCQKWTVHGQHWHGGRHAAANGTATVLPLKGR